MSFQQFLESRDIDIQTIEPEMLAALQSQYEREPKRSDSVSLLSPVAEVLVLPADCQWPARGYWTPAVTR